MRSKKLLYIAVGALVIIAIVAFFVLTKVRGLTIDTKGKNVEVLIPTGSTYESTYQILDSLLDISNPELFGWIVKKKNYPAHVRPGRYVVEPGMTYLAVIDMLRSGKQKPVNVTFNNIRTLNQLAGKVAEKIEPDSASIVSFLMDDSNYSKDGFTVETVLGVFLPNTYQMYWNTTAEGFYKRMLKEYRAFWNNERTEKAKQKGLDPMEVSIIASIVDDEVAKAEEKPRISGVYLNRLKIGMPLQACPTIKFALNDFTITRVLKKHLVVDSPYNTYMYRGLPPGPVGCPSVEGIESVLNAEEHDYLYFAAKSDFSGTHNFSRTLSEHNRYAAMYQRELNRRRIYK